MTTFNISQRQRIDTATNWTTANTVLAAGEIGIESDTGYQKVGDGTTAWTALAYSKTSASNIPYDDSVTTLGALNVQDAIVALDGNVDNLDGRVSTIEADYIRKTTQDFYAFDAGGNAGATRPSVSASTLVYWYNTPSKPTNLGVNDLWVGLDDAPSALTDGATITPNFGIARNFVVTLAGNRTLANPTNQAAGQSGFIIVKQDATGSRTLAYGANWLFAGGNTLSTTANAVDIIRYVVEASGFVRAVLFKSDVAGGGVTYASIATTNAGTATNEAVTPDGLAGSKFGTKELGLTLFRSNESVVVGDGVNGLPIPPSINGMDIISVTALCHTKGITGATDIQLRRRRGGVDTDVLSTKVTLGDEFFVADGVINTANDDLLTGDLLYGDVDAIHTTAPLGLTLVIEARWP